MSKKKINKQEGKEKKRRRGKKGSNKHTKAQGSKELTGPGGYSGTAENSIVPLVALIRNTAHFC
jgi:hypothetical protein